jgi:hypothetical protein
MGSKGFVFIEFLIVLFVIVSGIVGFITVYVYHFEKSDTDVRRFTHSYFPTKTITPTPWCSIPDGSPRNAHAITDSFTRRNEYAKLGNTETGQKWEIVNGHWGVFNNHAYCSDGPCKKTYALVETQSQNVQIDFKVNLGGPYPYSAQLAAPFRYEDDHNLYWLQASVSGQYTLNKKINGQDTILGTAAPKKSYITLSNPKGPLYDPVGWDTVRIIASGPHIEVVVNNTSLFKVTDCSLKGTKHGIGAVGTTNIDSVFDDFFISY